MNRINFLVEEGFKRLPCVVARHGEAGLAGGQPESKSQC
jgi:hypothetical protein